VAYLVVQLTVMVITVLLAWRPSRELIWCLYNAGVSVATVSFPLCRGWLAGWSHAPSAGWFRSLRDTVFKILVPVVIVTVAKTVPKAFLALVLRGSRVPTGV
jgi:hypothetical protein